MYQTILHRKLEAVIEAEKSVRQRYAVTVVLLVAAVIAAACVLRPSLVPVSGQAWAVLLPAIVIVLMLIARAVAEKTVPGVLDLARQIETAHPELRAALLTAMEQRPGANGKLGYLQERVLDEAVRHAVRHDWARSLSAERMRRSGWLLALGFIAFVTADWWMTLQLDRARPAAASAAKQADPKKPAPVLEVAVTPGDVEVEKGSRLTVEARFAKDAPESGAIIVSEPDGQERHRIPMRLTVDEKVFGGVISKIDADARYRVEFSGGKSDDYAITTFVLPALERADVRITPPDYAGQPVKEIKSTLKVSALEGSKLDFTIKVNKPLAAAELFGEDKTIIPLKPRADDPTVLVAAMQPEKSQKYRLHLVDDKERANKQPPWLTVNMLANQLPKIEVVFPKRDVQVSAIQELPLEARVSDDLGVKKAGAVLNLAGGSKEVAFKTADLSDTKKHDLKTLVALEAEKAEPRQLLSYYFWAEDRGPKGEARRAMSDMFFADVRHFEDIFREAEAPPSQPGKPQQPSETDQIVNLQKEVLNATWRIIRDTQAGRTMEQAAPDADVVRQSQEIALDKTKEAMEKAEDAEMKMALTEAWKSMKDAIPPLQQAADEKKKSALNQALAFEQTALEWLHRAQSREHRVMRQQNQSRSSSQQQANRQQLMNLELKQQDKRYEEEKQASEEQSAEQKENLQVLNRLKELARRQEALAEKMKQLEDQIAKAKTEQERDELANQLKRLQDEQEQLLRDVDDLKERMEKPENQSSMAEARDQLDKTREQVMDAAEKLKQQELAQAANAATRAQRELQDIQEDFRKKTSRKFSDEMRQMRDEARQLAEAQKKISEALENQKDATASRDPFDSAKDMQKMMTGAQTARAIKEQQERVKKLLEEMQRVSEQAEGGEPLLSRRLYDTVRQAHVNGVEENLAETHDYARLGDRPGAQEFERKATKAVEQMKQGVEQAAESILGSESEALRMARAEIDKLIEDVKPGGRADDSSSEKKLGAGKAKGEAAQAGDGERKGPGDETKDDSKQQAASGKGQQSGEPKGGKPSATGEEQPNAGEKAGQPGGADEKKQTAQTQKSQPGEGKPGESSQQGQGGEPGEQPGKEQMAQAGGQPQEGKPGDQPSKGLAGQQGQSSQSGQRPASSENRQETTASASSRQGGVGSNRGGDDRRRSLLPDGSAVGGGLFFEDSAEAEDTSPLTGAGFEQWSDRLRNIEELLNQPEMRNEAARVLDNARAMRVDFRRNNMPPQSDHVAQRIVNPLVELRDRVAEEIAKREAGNPLAPVDRDPVPAQFRDLVRKYYTELGAGK